MNGFNSDTDFDPSNAISGAWVWILRPSNRMISGSSQSTENTVESIESEMKRSVYLDHRDVESDRARLFCYGVYVHANQTGIAW
jgi:hypothetical protein